MSYQKTKEYKVVLEVYNGWDINVVIGKTLKDALQYSEKKYSPLDLSKSYASIGHAIKIEHDTTHETRFIVSLEDKSDPKVVVHECLHICWFFLEHIGVEVTVDNHEALAYLQEYLFESIMNIYKKRNKRKNVKRRGLSKT